MRAITQDAIHGNAATAWTVYVQTGMEATEDDVRRVGEALAKEAPGAVMAPAPVLGCWITVDNEPLPTRALVVAQSLFVLAVRQGLDVEDEVPITRVEMAVNTEAGRASRGFSTAKGLARHIGRTPSWVRTLMRYKGAPSPVDVDGGTETVYDTGLAMAYLTKVVR